jgi:hypothetical protein
LPQRRIWQLTALFTFFAVVLLIMTGFDIAAVVRYFTAGDSQFSGPIFDLFSAIIWGSFGLVALAVALMLSTMASSRCLLAAHSQASRRIGAALHFYLLPFRGGPEGP